MKKKGKWNIHTSKTIYENPWVTFIEEKGSQPDGKEGVHVLATYKPGVAVLPLDEEGNVYLNKEYRYAIEDISIETVAGGIEEGATPLESAKKELREELGIIANEWASLGVYHPLTETVLSPSTFYIARDLEFVSPEIEGTEDIERIKMPLSKAVEMVLSGEIKFAIAGLLILLAWEKFGKKIS